MAFVIAEPCIGLPRGFAFVEMTNDGEAEKAIRALNGSILRDRTLDVNYARPRPKTPSSLGERGPRRRGRVGECFWPCAGIQGLLGQLWTITFFLYRSVARLVLLCRNPDRSQAGAWPHPT